MPWFLIVLVLLAAPLRAADFSGQLDWSQRVALSTVASGVVERVDVQPGQTVRKGDLLLSLDVTRAKGAIAEVRAEVERLTQMAAEAKLEPGRAGEPDAARMRQASLQALLGAAQSRLERSRHELAEAEIRAPFDAVILDRQAEPGMIVASQCQPPALLTVARADEMLARATIEANALGVVKLGGAVGVSSGGRTYAGQVRAVRVAATGGYVAEVAFARPAGLLAGQAATIRLP